MKVLHLGREGIVFGQDTELPTHIFILPEPVRVVAVVVCEDVDAAQP